MAENPPPKNQNRSLGESEIFSYNDLEKATKYFLPDSILGGGDFGIVYRGQLKSGQIVAVKKLGDHSEQGDKKFVKEVITLSILRHPNIINLIGFSAERVERLLVYEFMPERSLDKHLHYISKKSKQLDWETRVKIALGTAKALDYLHNEAKPPVVFNDLKSENILLDESFHPKLSDFGIAEFDPTPSPCSGFSKEGYYVWKIKKDVYDFGCVLFELITGSRKTRIQGEPFDWLKDKLEEGKLEEAVDRQLERNDDVMRSIGDAAQVALACLDKNYLIRHDMHDVEQRLTEIQRMLQ